jgi:hypothetical protein
MTALTPEIIVDRLQPTDVCVSPDGRQVAFVVGPYGRRDEHVQARDMGRTE